MQTAASPSFGDHLESGQLAETTHAVRVGSDLVLLDLSTDGYLLIPDCGEVRIDGGAVQAPMDLMLDLAANELLQSGAPSVPRSPPPPIPRLWLPEAAVERPCAADIATFAMLWADTARRTPTLQSLSEQVSARRGRRDDPWRHRGPGPSLSPVAPLCPGRWRLPVSGRAPAPVSECGRPRALTGSSVSACGRSLPTVGCRWATTA